MPFEISFAGKTVIITGGATGLGLAAAEAFAGAGASIATIYGHNAEAPKITEDLGKKFSVKAKAYKCDIKSPSEVDTVFNQIATDFGGFHALFANSGTANEHVAVDVTEKDWDYLMDTNVKGTYFCAQAAAKYWIANKMPGSIVLNASMSGSIINTPTVLSVYCTSKAAVKHMAKALATEWGKHQIRVNSISPGYIETRMTTKKDREPINAVTPLGRMGVPREIGQMAMILCSEVSSYMTGSDVVVDGGFVCP